MRYSRLHTCGWFYQLWVQSSGSGTERENAAIALEKKHDKFYLYLSVTTNKRSKKFILQVVKIPGVKN